ncbi:hypothetical protein CHS0354_029789 [Potamilus streckersoni]|uniref:Uncharacterized protein n=1 Tax=Potamilus streckersoni TaxID=2493646 RepID=A0AAE0WDL2_9BIVA|nr:hypothetical protein CHS0354_029789 [Potamilus streckersoni]
MESSELQKTVARNSRLMLHFFWYNTPQRLKVCIQNRYKLNKKHRKWLSQVNTASGEVVEEKGLLQQARVCRVNLIDLFIRAILVTKSVNKQSTN